ncbi:MAG: aminotransferase class V-fold PLP-dependent enzyme [Bacteroidales bacterium]|nr:aminotransferase class V-fold PLP-dependent enzyme [Bacteroidales bacterium]
MDRLLEQAYNPEKFRALGHDLIDLLAGHLEGAVKGEGKVLKWKSPADQLKNWQENILTDQPLVDFFREIIENSIHIHNPRYMGHQVGATAPVAALTDMLGALLNNGMAIYEMGPAASAIENVVVGLFLKKLGYGADGDGYITSGGTLANLTALLAARKAMSEKDIWQEGHTEKLAVMVSSEAHYCVDRSLRIMGFGSEGIIKIPVDKRFCMDTMLLEQYLQDAATKGITVIAVAGSAPSTASGMYDDLEEIGRFCRKHSLWFHVDGAHGGAAIFSLKYKHLLKGIEMADSVVIDAHKMMMAPVLATFLLFKNKVHSYATFNQKALYLWEKQEEEEWYNYAKRTFECTKLMMSVKFYTIVKAYGIGIFDEFVTRQYDLGKTFAEKIRQHKNFELFLEPDSNIVCFRYFTEILDDTALNDLNSLIRRKVLELGDFYIVHTTLNGNTWLRVSLMNPFTGDSTLDDLLNHLVIIADELLLTK